MLLPLLGEQTVLDVVLRRCRRVYGAQVILAVPYADVDTLRYIAKRHDADFFVGSEYDVLGRYYDAAHVFALNEPIVRITSDCPLVSPALINYAVESFIGVDYASNCHPERTVPKGFDIEVFSQDVLRMAHFFAGTMQREHVTTWMHSCAKVRIRTLSGTGVFTDDNLSIDTEEDYKRVRGIFEHFNNDTFEWNDVRDYYQR